jgi:hypothetical protein
MSHQQNAGQNLNMKMAGRSFENVANFRYLGTKVTYQNCINDKSKSRLSSGNACNLSVQNLLFSLLLSKNLKIKIYKTITLSVILYVCGSWSLTIREEPILRVFGNRMLRRIFGPKRDEVIGGWRKLHNGSFIACTLLQV